MGGTATGWGASGTIRREKRQEAAGSGRERVEGVYGCGRGSNWVTAETRGQPLRAEATSVARRGILGGSPMPKGPAVGRSTPRKGWDEMGQPSYGSE